MDLSGQWVTCVQTSTILCFNKGNISNIRSLHASLSSSSIIIIISIPHASRRLKPSRLIALSTLTCFFLSRHPAGQTACSAGYFPNVFGLPLALRPSEVLANAVKQSFLPSTYVSQVTSLISAISTTSLLLFVLCCHRILSFRPRHWRWRETVQVSSNGLWDFPCRTFHHNLTVARQPRSRPTSLLVREQTRGNLCTHETVKRNSWTEHGKKLLPIMKP